MTAAQTETHQQDALHPAPLQQEALQTRLMLAKHPPKPQLTLRVGITGHRPKKERLPQ